MEGIRIMEKYGCGSYHEARNNWNIRLIINACLKFVRGDKVFQIGTNYSWGMALIRV